MRKGDKLERDYSISIHRSHLPVLVSSKLLRSMNAGQIDLAGLSKINKSWVLTIFEIKSLHYPSMKQWQRLRRTQDYLSRSLGIDTKLEVKFCQKDQP